MNRKQRVVFRNVDGSFSSIPASDDQNAFTGINLILILGGVGAILVVGILVVLSLPGIRSKRQPPSMSNSELKLDLVDLVGLEASAEKDDVHAQLRLASLQWNGVNVPVNKAESVKWLLRAIRQSNPEAQFTTHKFLVVEEGMAAEFGGLAGAQLLLGLDYAEGIGVTKDEVEAGKWMQKAAKQGNVPAEYELGRRYLNGTGVAKDIAIGATWIRTAADKGHAEAELALARLYEAGEGVPRDQEEARKWIRKAAEHGLSKAQSELADAYYAGEGVPQNYTEAARWASQAARQGDPKAQFIIGGLYAVGFGVPKDEVLAYAWINAGAAKLQQVREHTSKMKATLVGTMTPEQIARAQSLSDEIFKGQFDAPELSNSGPAAGRVSSNPRLRSESASTANAGDLVAKLLRRQNADALQMSAQEIAKTALRSVVIIVVNISKGESALGSGFFVAPNRVVTNSHVIKGGTARAVKLVGSSTFFHISKVLVDDPDLDLAILEVNERNATVLPLADAAFPEVGEEVYVVGNPRGLEGTFSKGNVSAHRRVSADRVLLQITAPVSEGSSGGAVLNQRGQVVGITVSIYKEGQNLNFAIPVEELRRLIRRVP